MPDKFYDEVRSIASANDTWRETSREERLVKVAEELRRFDLPDWKILSIIREVFYVGQEYEMYG